MEHHGTLNSRDLQLLNDDNWLNDSFIEAYLCFLKSHSGKDLQKNRNLKNFEVLSTHFFTTIRNKGIKSVDSWYKKADIFDVKLLIVPINEGNIHWTLLVVNNREKTMTYYDSIRGLYDATDSFSQMKQYLSRQSMLRRIIQIDWTEWKTINASEIPQQQNGNDCGVFLLQYAYCVVHRRDMDFSQADIPQIRCRIQSELTNVCKSKTAADSNESISTHVEITNSTDLAPITESKNNECQPTIKQSLIPTCQSNLSTDSDSDFETALWKESPPAIEIAILS
ncbi:sentrin-specific protease 1-like [Corticium candelabrum]|uniref:sentrin-specific protease 1-like n=1 Tax=Corticium candelabrum TaxID=121492 RepID=UPI002E269379|nr:sentrin-specific protease 1-like [Corticium candelabrum]